VAQAEAIPTTRRQFSKWLAAVGATAFIAVPAASREATVDWQALEAEYLGKLEEIFAANEKIAAADKGFRAWEKRNPYPVEPDYDSHNARIADFRRLRDAQSKHAERWCRARMQCGIGKAQKQRLVLQDEWQAIEMRIADIPAKTLADIRSKALIGRHNVSGLINQSLSKDLLNLNLALT